MNSCSGSQPRCWITEPVTDRWVIIRPLQLDDDTWIRHTGAQRLQDRGRDPLMYSGSHKFQLSSSFSQVGAPSLVKSQVYGEWVTRGTNARWGLPCGDDAPLWMVVTAEPVRVSISSRLHRHASLSWLPDPKGSAKQTQRVNLRSCFNSWWETLRTETLWNLSSVTIARCKPSGENWMAEIWFCP